MRLEIFNNPVFQSVHSLLQLKKFQTYIDAPLSLNFIVQWLQLLLVYVVIAYRIAWSLSDVAGELCVAIDTRIYRYAEFV